MGDLRQDGLQGLWVLTDYLSDLGELRVVEEEAELVDSEMLASQCCALSLGAFCCGLGLRGWGANVGGNAVDEVLHCALLVEEGSSEGSHALVAGEPH